ncbi:FANCF [Cervus elaphus hippelaphus]|uniref:FANCF n=1 Tax=Cervus elaphus hippelaphus TaxID=46360 RepID=A0A212DGD9_CEREH|nr:FANCF [Cervus elaphus hippelaphus]
MRGKREAFQLNQNLLSLRLLANPALGDAAFHCLLQQLFPGPGVPDAEEEALQGSLIRFARCRTAAHMLRFHAYRENPVLQKDSLMKTQAELLLRRLQEVGEAEAESPGRLLSRLWERLPQNNFLKVMAAALLLPPASPRLQEEELERLLLHCVVGRGNPQRKPDLSCLAFPGASAGAGGGTLEGWR